MSMIAHRSTGSHVGEKCSPGMPVPIVPTLRVVLADRQPAFRAGVRVALDGHGFVVAAETHTGPGAVEAVLRERPDLCLIDVGVPGNGILAARRIRTKAPETSVVMVTSSPDITEVVAAWKAGATGYLERTIKPARLPLALRAVAGGEAVLPGELTAGLTEELGRRPKRRRRHPVVRRQRVRLTEREWEVADLLCAELTTAQIAARLSLTEVTVRRHISEIAHKLDANDRGSVRRLLSSNGHRP
jgi:two-component system, NarL family, nitrate/nitrite response regulator NarL